MKRAYLDYNATAPVLPEVIALTAEIMGRVGNASSIHGFGRDARKTVEDARAQVAALAAVRPAQVVFNAGATEGNNTILSGFQDQIIYINSTEHPSIIESAPNAIHVPVTKDGVIDLAALEKMMAERPPALLCLQLVNSETGAIQPVAEASEIARKHSARILCDAVQAAGRIPIDFKSLNVDYLTLSAHKFGGPQGVGALIFREGLQLPKLLRGGGQERRQRAGTENVAGIAGFGLAAQKALENMGAYQSACEAFRAKLESGLKEIAPQIIIAGENAARVCNTTCAILPGVSAETQLMNMDLEGVAVGSGSACSSGAMKPSHVLTAMSFSESDARASLRFSTGWATTIADIDAALNAYEKMAARVGKQN
jgi:cysteine desulfurase